MEYFRKETLIGKILVALSGICLITALVAIIAIPYTADSFTISMTANMLFVVFGVLSMSFD